MSKAKSIKITESQYDDMKEAVAKHRRIATENLAEVAIDSAFDSLFGSGGWNVVSDSFGA